MKSSVNLAVLAVLILCCVHGGVAGKHRGKYLKKKRKNQSHTKYL